MNVAKDEVKCISFQNYSLLIGLMVQIDMQQQQYKSPSKRQYHDSQYS